MCSTETGTGERETGNNVVNIEIGCLLAEVELVVVVVRNKSRTKAILSLPAPSIIATARLPTQPSPSCPKRSQLLAACPPRKRPLPSKMMTPMRYVVLVLGIIVRRLQRDLGHLELSTTAPSCRLVCISSLASRTKTMAGPRRCQTSPTSSRILNSPRMIIHHRSTTTVRPPPHLVVARMQHSFCWPGTATSMGLLAA